MNLGWIKLFRKSLSNPLFKKPLVWHCFTYCLLKANHEDSKIIFNKKELIVERGSFLTGRKGISMDTGLSEQNVRSAMQTLQNLGMIEKSTSKSTNQYSYITICNYEEYNNTKNEGNQQINQRLTSDQPATNQRLTTNKNIKNEKNVKNDKEEEEDIFINKNTSKNAFLTPEKLANFWNTYACVSENIPKVSKLNNSRKEKAKARIKENGDPNFWRELFIKITKLPFYCGNNDNKWVVTFDWIVKNDSNYIKIQEANTKIKKIKDNDDKEECAIIKSYNEMFGDQND